MRQHALVTLSVTLCVTMLIVMAIVYLDSKQVTEQSVARAHAAEVGVQLLPQRQHCDTDDVYCSTDSDCQSQCILNDGWFGCQAGVCRRESVYQPVNPVTCQLSEGYRQVFVADSVLGKMSIQCKSVDPGVAPDDVTQPNRMCAGGHIDIDYTRHLPTIGDCVAPYQSTIPATLTERKYVVAVGSESVQRYLAETMDV